MKKVNDHPYSNIGSFMDFRLERERLILKGRLIETRINMEIILIREVFSVSSLLISFAREYILPGLSGIITDFLNIKEEQEEQEEQQAQN